MRRLVAISIGLLILVGCRSKVESLSGTITYKGQPVNNVMLHLYPVDGKSPDVPIPVTQEGTFRTTGVKPGEYKVVVIPPQTDDMASKFRNMKGAQAEEAKKKLQQNQSQEKPTIAFPRKYQNTMSSDLKCTITGGQQVLPLELKE